MKFERKIIILSIVAGMIFWFADALGDKFLLPQNESFIEILLHDAPNHHILIRPFVVLMFLTIGILSSLYHAKFKESEKRYQQLFENVNDAIFIKPFGASEAREKFIEANEAAGRMLGYSKEELLQLSPRDIIDPERLAELSLLMEKLGTEGQALFETTLVKKDGSKIPVENNTLVFEFKGLPVCLTIARDISRRRRDEAALRESASQLRLLTDRLLRAQEEERSRISQELHDELGQSLMFLKLQLSSLHDRLPKRPSSLRNDCEDLLRHLAETIDNVRRLSQDLKPWGLEELGISLAIRLLIEESCRLYGIKSCTIDLDGIEDLLPPEAQLNLYRIFQESMTNIGKHAHATEVFAGIKKETGQILIRIQDNGKGFDPAKASRLDERKGLGLSTIKERTRLLGGRLEVLSHPGQGTEIIITSPIREMALAPGGESENDSLSNPIG